MIDKLILKLESVRSKYYTEYMLRSVRSDLVKYKEIFEGVGFGADRKENFMEAVKNNVKSLHRNMLISWFNENDNDELNTLKLKNFYSDSKYSEFLHLLESQSIDDLKWIDEESLEETFREILKNNDIVQVVRGNEVLRAIKKYRGFTIKAKKTTFELSRIDKDVNFSVLKFSSDEILFILDIERAQEK
jgi:hypothetical protein